MKTIFALLFATTICVAPLFANRNIYLKTDGSDYHFGFSLLNPADSVYVQIIAGFPNLEGGGGGAWLAPPKFVIKLTAPDDKYTVFVDGEQKQTGRLKNGKYSGYAWQPDQYEDRWMITHYKNGKKQGAENIFQSNYGHSDYVLASFQWYDNDQQPVEMSFYPSGSVRYSILNHLHIFVGEDSTLSISETGGEWRTLGLPIVKGRLDGMAQWFKGGNGVGTQWFRMTFKENRLVKWELQEAITQDSIPVVAHYEVDR